MSLARNRFTAPLLAAVLLFPTALLAQVPLTIVHVNDTHSHLDGFGPRGLDLEPSLGGLARAATIIGQARATEPNVLFLHAGDFSHGDYLFNTTFGVPELRVLQQLGVDAVAVGNHEFDFGPAFLATVLGQAGPLPLVSANLDFAACLGTPNPCGDLASRIAPAVVREIDGIKVAIIGMTVPTDALMQPGPVVVRGRTNPAEVVQIAGVQVATARTAGAKVVILLSHLGHRYDEAIAANVPGINLIVRGHDHELLETATTLPGPGGWQTTVVSAGEFYSHVGKVRLLVDTTTGTVTVDGAEVIAVDRTVSPEPQVEALVDQLAAGVVEKYGDVYRTPVAFALWDIKKEWNPESPRRDTGIGNFVTDAMRLRTRTTVAIAATGLLGDRIYHGPVVGTDLFRLTSYGYDRATGLGFKLVTADMTGAELLKALEGTLQYYGLDDAFFLQFSGLTYRFDSTLPALSRVVPGSVRIHGAALNPAATYSVTFNEGIAALLPLLKIQATNLVVRPDFETEVVQSYARRLHLLAYASMGRIKDVSVTP
jgi:5'-nucleotidase